MGNLPRPPDRQRRSLLRRHARHRPRAGKRQRLPIHPPHLLRIPRRRRRQLPLSLRPQPLPPTRHAISRPPPRPPHFILRSPPPARRRRGLQPPQPPQHLQRLRQLTYKYSCVPRRQRPIRLRLDDDPGPRHLATNLWHPAHRERHQPLHHKTTPSQCPAGILKGNPSPEQIPGHSERRASGATSREARWGRRREEPRRYVGLQFSRRCEHIFRALATTPHPLK